MQNVPWRATLSLLVNFAFCILHFSFCNLRREALPKADMIRAFEANDESNIPRIGQNIQDWFRTQATIKQLAAIYS